MNMIAMELDSALYLDTFSYGTNQAVVYQDIILRHSLNNSNSLQL
jgi:hypothetical protein